MKKIILCSCLVAALLCCLIVPSFAVDWYGSSSQVLSGYTFTVSNTTAIDPVPEALSSWLTAIGAVSTSTAVGPFSCRTSSSVTNDFMIFIDGSTIRNTNRDKLTQIYSGSYTVNSTDGYDYAAAVGGNTSVTDVYTTVNGGFVSDGFSSALGIAGTVVNFCTSNSYVLIAIGLAVGVPLVGWGISKLKSLIKGY